MTTLAEVRKWLRERREDMGLFGVNPKFEAEFGRRAREVYAAIVAENNLSSLWLRLPDDTVLGDRSLELFNDLVDWAARNADPDEVVGLS